MTQPFLRQARSRAAFTLIELLVVIAIISILAAMLFPAFARVREAARKTTCLSNTRNISMGVMMYAQDYDEGLPAWRNCPVVSQDGATACTLDQSKASLWANTLQSYLKNKQVLFCPSFVESETAKAMDQADCDGDGTTGSGSGGVFPAAEYYAHIGMSYPLTMNAGQCDTVGNAPYLNFAGSGWTMSGGTYHFNLETLSSIATPARTAYLSDGASLLVHTPGGDMVGNLFGCEGRFRHIGGTNLAFLDGHSKWSSDNPERHLAQDENGCYYEEYFSKDK